MHIYLINRHVHVSYKNQVLSNSISFVSFSVRKLHARDWLGKFVSLHGDRMPDREITNLPASLTKGEIYGLYSMDFEEKGWQTIELSTFRLMWRKDFSHVKIPAVSRNIIINNKCMLIDSMAVLQVLSDGKSAGKS